MLICKLCGAPMRLVTQSTAYKTFGCSKGCPDSYQCLENGIEIKSAAQVAAQTRNSSPGNSQQASTDFAQIVGG